MKEIKKKGIATTALQCELPFCLYMDDGLYQLISDKEPGAIQIWRKPRYLTVEELPFNKMGVIANIDPLNCEMKGDRFGHVAYSELVVYMPSRESTVQSQSMFGQAVKYVNRLIEVYRTVTGEFWIQPISTADLVVTQCRHCDEYGKQVPGLVYGAPLRVPGLSIGGPVPVIASGAAAIKRSPEIHLRIRQMMEQDIRIPTYTSLMLNALSSIRFGRFPSAIVESQTAFENFFYTFTKYELLRKKCMTLTLQDELDKGLITRPIGKGVAGRKGMDKLAYFSQLVTTPSRSFANGVTEHDNWFSQTYEMRNKIIHRGKDDVTQKQAEGAFKAVEDSFVFFNQDWRNLTFD